MTRHEIAKKASEAVKDPELRAVAYDAVLRDLIRRASQAKRRAGK